MLYPSILILVVSMLASTFAEAKSYYPVGLANIDSTVVGPKFLSVKEEALPVLPGIRPVELELLEDALRRKMPRSVGISRDKAQAKIIRNALRDPVKRAHMKGILAEALFLERNPNWGYVSSPTASQHDVYTWVSDRRSPYTAQIKTHSSANPLIYASDMVKDHRSVMFLIPDDHVEPLKRYLKNQLRYQESTGDMQSAAMTRNQLIRVKGLGYTSKQLDQSYSTAARLAFREQYTGYVSLAATAAMAFGPELWDSWQTGAISNNKVIALAHAGSLIGAERLSSYAVSRQSSVIQRPRINAKSTGLILGKKAYPGSMSGNVVVSMSILATDTAFSVYEHGGRKAFQNEGFYTNLGGGVSALMAAWATGIPVAWAVSEMTSNPVIGVGVGMVTAASVGTAAHIGGQRVTSAILEGAQPEFILSREKSAILNAEEDIQKKMQLTLNKRY